MNKSNDKVVLITGAARRVGAVIARTMHAHGYRVVIHYRHSAADAQTLADELTDLRADSAATVQGDLSDMSGLQHVAAESVKTFDQLDALVNNASSFYPTPLAECSEESFDDLIGSNLKAPIFLSQQLANELKKNGGCIVNVTDIYADRPLADHVIYCAAKAGLVSATKSLARELAPDVRVNAVAPGAIIWPENTSNAAINDDSQKEILRRTPLARAGSPEDIASAVVYLIANAPFVSGQVIAVDGGRTAVP